MNNLRASDWFSIAAGSLVYCIVAFPVLILTYLEKLQNSSLHFTDALIFMLILFIVAWTVLILAVKNGVKEALKEKQ